MSPVLMTGDVVGWTPVSIQDVKVGDVVVYKSWLHWPDTKVVVHRVVEIREEFGKRALVTKGDANQWTDQAGPHIPEPYVLDQNLIGKAIMIGPVPLKIPFVGYLGLWISQGFQVLSQSSASKGAVASLVVFLPLTVSVILLVVAVFLLPQRRKTLQEKIHGNIITMQSLNLRRTALFFFVIFTVFLMIIHAFAFDSVTGAVGVGEFPSKNGLDLGSLTPGHTGPSRNISIINPSVFPMQGVVFGKGALASLLSPVSFYVNPGQVKDQKVHASAPNGTANGSYLGEIVIYSSPLWLILPSGILLAAVRYNPEMAVPIIDLLCALVLTTVTILLMIVIAFISDKITVLQVNLSWQHVSRTLMKTGVRQRLQRTRTRVVQGFLGKTSWMNKIDLASIQALPFLVGGLIVIPFFLLMSSEIVAMILAAFFSGIIVYHLNCQRREKIVLATVSSLYVSVSIILIHAGWNVFSSARPFLESLTMAMGVLGIYLLALAFFLAPLVLISWFITHEIRNVKEQRDPLLALEGGCDL